MAWKDMKVAPINVGVQNKFTYEYEESLAAAGDGHSIIIPDEIASISVTVSFTGGGTGKVQTSTDTVGVVKEGSAAVWADWDSGVVSSTTQDMCAPVTAIRAVQVHAGAMKITVRAQ